MGGRPPRSPGPGKGEWSLCARAPWAGRQWPVCHWVKGGPRTAARQPCKLAPAHRPRREPKATRRLERKTVKSQRCPRRPRCAFVGAGLRGSEPPSPRRRGWEEGLRGRGRTLGAAPAAAPRGGKTMGPRVPSAVKLFSLYKRKISGWGAVFLRVIQRSSHFHRPK